MTSSIDDPRFEIRDAVHGFVRLTAREVAIVNTPTFQRLRDIRQLAVAHFVYPGATHSRLEHSLGCVHLTDQIYDHLLRQQKRREGASFEEAFGASDAAVGRGRALARLAALLHDVGHAAFSHSGEHVMPKEDIDGINRQVKHEDMTARLIRHTEIGDLIDKLFANEGITREQVIQVATTPQFHAKTPGTEQAWMTFLNELIAGELGSDRMDYLLRDAAHSGQETGRFDHRRLIDAMRVAKPPSEEHDVYRLAVGDGGILTAEQMIAARYLMYITLYFHKTKRVLEKHMERYLPLWLRARFGSEYLPTAESEKYQTVTDSPVWASLIDPNEKSPDSVGAFRDIFLSRRHFRLATEFRVSDLVMDPGGSTGTTETLKVVKDRLDNIGQSVIDLFGHESVIVDVADHSATKMHEAGNKMWVVVDDNTRYLGQVSEVVSGMSRRVWRARIYATENVREKVACEARRACGELLKREREAQ